MDNKSIPSDDSDNSGLPVEELSVLVHSDVTGDKKADQESLTMLSERDLHHVNVINMMRSGYVFARVVYEKGSPVDFIHEEVNAGYETITGLKNVIGKKITEVFPGIKTKQPEFFEQHVSVAETGVSNRFDIYLQPLQKWFNISVHSLKKGYFISIIDDITNAKQDEIALKASEQRFKNMFREHSAIMVIIDPATGSIIDVNHAATTFYGWSHEELCKMNVGQINMLPPDEIKSEMEQSISGKKNKFLFRHRRANGSIRDVEVYISKIETLDKPLLYAIIHDVTERIRYEIANTFRLSIFQMLDTCTIKEVLQKTLDEAEKLTMSSIGFFHFVEEDQTTLSLQAWSTNTEKTGCKVPEKREHYCLDKAGVWADAVRERKSVIHNDYVSLKSRKGMPEGHVVVRREVVIPIFHGDNIIALMGVGNKPSDYDEEDLYWLEMLAGHVQHIIAIKVGKEKQDILQMQNYIIEKLAMHDSLTGLPNRRLLSERITVTLAQCRRNKTKAALFILDLDKFKIVNDTLGHGIGDLLLKEVSTRMLKILRRRGDSPARLGGDEFVVLLPQIDAVVQAITIAEKIRYALYQPFDIEGHIINISSCIGIAVFPDHGDDELTLMKHADAAMYKAKNDGRNCIKVFNEEVS